MPGAVLAHIPPEQPNLIGPLRGPITDTGPEVESAKAPSLRAVLANIVAENGIKDQVADALEMLAGVVSGKAILRGVNCIFAIHAPIESRKKGEDRVDNKAPLLMKAPKCDGPQHAKSARHWP